MSGSITLTISLFGAFRPYGNGETITLEVPQGASVSEAKNHLKAALKKVRADFDKATLVDESALADDTQILADDMTLSGSTTLAILPPVCGG
jgi:molybdopterin converting factor small subunit